MHPLLRRLSRRLRRRPLAALFLAAVLLAPLAALCLAAVRPPPDPVPEARLLLRSGDASGAVVRLRAAVERRPRDARAWHLLGEALRLSGQREDADEAARRALSLAPDWDAPAVALIASALADGRVSEARRLVTEKIQRGVGTPALLRLRARLREDDADFRGAADDLERVARGRGGRARDLLDAARLRRADAFVTGVDDGRAAELVSEAAERARSDEGGEDALAAARLALGQVVGDGPPEDARHERALRLLLVLHRVGFAARARGLAARLCSDVPIERLRHGARTLPPQDRVRIAALLALPDGAAAAELDGHEANAHLAAARRAAMREHDALTLAHLRELVLRRPDDPDAAFALGTRLGAERSAEQALTIAERLPGGAVGAAGRRLLGWYHVGAEEPERAASFLLPDGTAPSSGRADAALTAAAGDGPDATEASARSALLRRPADGLPHLLLGLVAAHRGRPRAACVALSAALARDPSLHVAANDLAWWLTVRGDRAQRAAPLAAWALYLAPADPRVRDTAAEVRRRVRDATLGHATRRGTTPHERNDR